MTLEPYKKTLKLDDQMDLTIDSLQVMEMTQGSAKVAQDLEVLFRTHLNDNIFHPNLGLDFEAITVNYSDNVIKDEFRQALIQYPYVKEIVDISVSRAYSESEVQITVDITITMYTEEELSLSVTI